MSEKDYKRQTIDYIKTNLRKGYKKESLKWALVKQGHSKFEIQRSFEKAEQEMAQEAPVLRTPQEMPKIEPIIEEKKKGFFGRLFG